MARGFAALVLGTVLLTVPKQSGAAVFVGAFDPPFGTAFPTLGFRGQGTFFVPDACLVVTGTVFGEDCGGMTVTSAFVDFYNVPPAVGGPTIASHTFVPPVQSLNEVIFVAGNIVGVETDLIGPDPVLIPSIYSGNMWLQFLDGTEFVDDSDVPSAPGAYLLACSASDTSCDSPNIQSDPAAITFTRVPEPSSIALVLGALGVAGFTRRWGSGSLSLAWLSSRSQPRHVA